MHNHTKRVASKLSPPLSPLGAAVFDTSRNFLGDQSCTPSLLTDLCEGLFESLDEFYEQNPPPHDLACGPGCAFCCHNQVRATLPEILSIARFIRKTRSEFDRQLLIRDIERHTQRIRGLTPQDIPRDLPCIFLQEDRCSVYEVRPFACRAWHSLNREDCHQAFEEQNPLAPVEHYPERRRAAVDFVQGMTRALDRVHIPGGDIMLPLGIKAVLPFPLDRMEQGWFPLFQIHQRGHFPNIA